MTLTTVSLPTAITYMTILWPGTGDIAARLAGHSSLGANCRWCSNRTASKTQVPVISLDVNVISCHDEYCISSIFKLNSSNHMLSVIIHMKHKALLVVITEKSKNAIWHKGFMMQLLRN